MRTLGSKGKHVHFSFELYLMLRKGTQYIGCGYCDCAVISFYSRLIKLYTNQGQHTLNGSSCPLSVTATFKVTKL